MRQKLLIGVILSCAVAFGSFFLTKKSRHSHKARISFLDNSVYTAFCLQAATDENSFDHFKRSSAYQLFLGQTSYDEGREYLKIISSRYGDLLDHLEKFRKNDEIGDPKTFDFGAAGKFSPTTLRYIKVAGDLKNLFGNLDGLKVLEIGGGYGGQCKILLDLFSFKSYTLAELPSCLKLSQKYLEKQGITNVKFVNLNEIPQEHYDLVISNYSFNDLDRSLQKLYLEKILKTSSFGYITCHFTPKYLKTAPFSKNELLTQFQQLNFPVKQLAEEPQTGRDNFILSWKTSHH